MLPYHTLRRRVSAAIAEHPELEMVAKNVTQSSDSEFHCLSITLFYREKGKLFHKSPGENTDAAPFQHAFRRVEFYAAHA